MKQMKKIMIAALSLSFFCGHAQADNQVQQADNTIKDQRAMLATSHNAPNNHVDVVSDEVLSTIRGKYLAGLTIIGLQLELLSQWAANGNSLNAGGVLQVVRVGDGYQIQMGSHASSVAGDTWSSSAGAVATGAGSLQVAGIAQVSQLAGDSNQHTNLTLIDFSPQDMSSQLNGQSSSQAGTEGSSVSVNFSEHGANLEINSSHSTLMQQVAIAAGADTGGIMQVGSLVGNDQTSSNLLRLHVMTAPTNQQAILQSNVLQALQLIQLPKH